MKALTLTQPWAALVAIGAKHIETRSWATSYRGPLAIHAAKGIGSVGGAMGLMSLCRTEPFRAALLAGGILGTPLLPRGAIIATCELIDCVPTVHPGIANEPGKPWFTGAHKGVGQHYYEVPPPQDSNEFAFGDYSPGRFAWLLADVKLLPRPIPCKGALGLWRVDAPALAAIAEQIRAVAA